uniref:Uncharacterized protein n=1 Tax=Plectus sambesii TaxID=2011161 RepID=A0A914WKF8_9BILA
MNTTTAQSVISTVMEELQKNKHNCNCLKLKTAEEHLVQFKIGFFVVLGILIVIVVAAAIFGLIKAAPRIRESARRLLNGESGSHLQLNNDEDA